MAANRTACTVCAYTYLLAVSFSVCIHLIRHEKILLRFSVCVGFNWHENSNVAVIDHLRIILTLKSIWPIGTTSMPLRVMRKLISFLNCHFRDLNIAPQRFYRNLLISIFMRGADMWMPYGLGWVCRALGEYLCPCDLLSIAPGQLRGAKLARKWEKLEGTSYIHTWYTYITQRMESLSIKYNQMHAIYESILYMSRERERAEPEPLKCNYYRA